MNKIVTKKLEDIAKKELHIDTFEVRNSDRLDFYDCSIWCIQKALKDAYELGVKDTKKKNKKVEVK